MSAKPNIERTNECSVCKSKEFLKFKGGKFEDGFKFTITCSKCGSSVDAVDNTIERVKTKAIKKWNSEEEIYNIFEIPTINLKETKCVKDVEKVEKENFILDSSKVVVPKDKALSVAKGLIKRFKNSHPKEICPVTLGDLLVLFGLSDDEIRKELSYNRSSKKFIKSFNEIMSVLDKGISIYRVDKAGRTWKYSPICKLDEYDSEELLSTLKVSGFNEKNTFILNDE